MDNKLQTYKDIINRNTKKSNDIMLKVIWGFLLIVILVGIFSKIGMFRVEIDFVIGWGIVVAISIIVVYILRKFKVDEEIFKYVIVLIVHICLMYGASQGALGVYCSFLIPSLISIAYMDKKFIYTSCVMSYAVLVISLYNISEYRVENFYQDYTRIRWFVAFLIGYTLEYIGFVLAVYTVTKRIEGIIGELSEQNTRVINMQNDVIAGFAGLVESRDNHTGEHVKRTADTVKLIMESMFENNIYEGELDEKDAKIIEMAAPLHDIGKIKIPDAILCKPAKLTEEEFSKMKYHTREGERIIDEYLDRMEEAEFINTARDIVLSHHERWDGKGYPNNLKGEEIPISARIMAVADVFDALISKRCYKEAFSFEESFKIIMEGSGTQFDPEIVKALKLKEKELMELYANVSDKENKE